MAAVALMATACQAPPPATIVQEGHTSTYTVKLELDGTSLGQRAATIRLSGAAPEPERVAIVSSMPGMDMPGATVTAQHVSQYRYEAHGELFTMLGKWRIEVRLTIAGTDEAAIFDVTAVP